ncbi:MAG: alpha/beta hydrolase [Armatimonadota bacterium]
MAQTQWLLAAVIVLATMSGFSASCDSAGDKRTPDDYPLGPDSTMQAGVPRGELTKYSWASKIYLGTVRDYWVYVPAQYNASKPACVMVFQDGWLYANPDGAVRATIVSDNLISKEEMPVTISIFINPGNETEKYNSDPRDFWGKYHESQRAAEYDVLGDRYARYLLEEILPEVGKKYNLTKDPNGRAICGISSGGLCAWTVAWEKPDAFRKVFSQVGSFDDIRGGHVYPFLIRKAEKKPIRVFLQDGKNDLNCVCGDWYLGNLQMESALKYKGYDYKFVVGDGAHTVNHGAAIFPDALRWLWRDWKSENK